MQKPSIKVKAAYQVECTPELFEQAWKEKYREDKMTSAEIKEAKKDLRGELSSIVLLEVLVENADENFDAGDFEQPDSGQAAYDEFYLAVDSDEIIAEGFDQPKTPSFRVLFFMHFFKPGKPLKTSYGKVPVPKVEPMPDSLAKLHPYQPVD